VKVHLEAESYSGDVDNAEAKVRSPSAPPKDLSSCGQPCGWPFCFLYSNSEKV